MDFNEILNILKGDVVGHPFHGNQWLKTNGKFDPNGQGGRRGGRVAQPKPVRERKPAAVRAPKPAPARKPAAVRAPQPAPQSAPAPQPAVAVSPKPVDSNFDGLGNGKQYMGPSSAPIVKVEEDLSGLGGNQQAGMQRVLLADGTEAMVKTIGDWRGIYAEDLAQSEVTAGKIAEAMDLPIRGAVMKEGSDNTIVQPFINGQVWKSLSDTTYISSIPATALPPEWKQTIGEMRLFDELTGNTDRHNGNVMVSGVPNDFSGTMAQAAALGGVPVGIDQSLCFLATPNKFSMRSIALDYGISDSRLSEMATGLSQLKSTTSPLTYEQQTRINNVAQAFREAFPRAFK